MCAWLAPGWGSAHATCPGQQGAHAAGTTKPAPDAKLVVTPPRRKALFGSSSKGKVGNMPVLVFRDAKSECDQQINCWNRAGLGNLVPKRLGLGVIGSRTFEILLLKISLCIFLSCSLEGCSPQIKVGYGSCHQQSFFLNRRNEKLSILESKRFASAEALSGSH